MQCAGLLLHEQENISLNMQARQKILEVVLELNETAFDFSENSNVAGTDALSILN